MNSATKKVKQEIETKVGNPKVDLGYDCLQSEEEEVKSPGLVTPTLSPLKSLEPVPTAAAKPKFNLNLNKVLPAAETEESPRIDTDRGLLKTQG